MQVKNVGLDSLAGKVGRMYMPRQEVIFQPVTNLVNTFFVLYSDSFFGFLEASPFVFLG
jgi:hypothetical protein